jgi:hypothetical protein
MANLLQKASIVLTPTAYNNNRVMCVKPSDGNGDLTFSRNSAATRVNAQGLVENVQILSSNLVQNGDFSEEGAEEGVARCAVPRTREATRSPCSDRCAAAARPVRKPAELALGGGSQRVSWEDARARARGMWR